MHGAANQRSDAAAVLRLAPGWESRGRNLSPQEGFLLSRIDGRTPWATLRSIAGIPPEQVDTCLERWISEGLIVVEGSGPEPGSGAPPPPRTRIPSAGVAVDVDPGLDLSVEFQQRVLSFERDLERPYHEILGVPVDADPRDIKRAYFKLSKDFHPDRYFRKRVGAFEKVLDRIFKKVALAYELLMDPATRAEVQRSLASRAPESPSTPTPRAPAQRGYTKQEWLERMRKRFRIPDSLLAERRMRARQFFDASRAAQLHQNWKEAGACIRLAIAFDPWTEEYKTAFGEVQMRLHELRADELVEQANAALQGGAQGDALGLLEEAMHYRPSDPEIQGRAAQAALQSGDMERAREFAERACELSPDTARYQLVLGRVRRRDGAVREAMKAFETAARLDPADPEAREELKRLRQRPGPQTGGRR